MKIQKKAQMDFQALYNKAHKAGMEALKNCSPVPMVVQEHQNKLDDSSPVTRSYYVPQGMCGFAWINVKPGNCAFANWAKAHNLARKNSHEGGVTFWVREGNQSHELKRAYAEAFANVLFEFGITATVGDRLD